MNVNPYQPSDTPPPEQNSRPQRTSAGRKVYVGGLMGLWLGFYCCNVPFGWNNNLVLQLAFAIAGAGVGLGIHVALGGNALRVK